MNSNRKVVLFGPCPPPYGGVAVHAMILFNHLNSRVQQFLAYGDFNDSGSKITKVSFNMLDSSFFLKKIISLPKGYVFHDHSALLAYPSIFKLIPYVFTIKFKSLKWVLTIHDGTLPERYADFSFFQKLAFKLSISCIKHIICVSDELKQWLIDDGLINESANKCSVIPSLLPPMEDDPFNVNLPPVLADFVKDYPNFAISIGVFLDIYDFKTILQAIEKIKLEPDYADMGLILIDGKYARDDMYYDECSVKNEDWCIVYENLPNEILKNLIKMADVFIRGVRSESYGLSRIEAILVQTPVVATPVGETRGMFLYEHKNVDSLVKEIKCAMLAPLNHIEKMRKIYLNEAYRNLESIEEIYDSI